MCGSESDFGFDSGGNGENHVGFGQSITHNGVDLSNFVQPRGSFDNDDIDLGYGNDNHLLDGTNDDRLGGPIGHLNGAYNHHGAIQQRRQPRSHQPRQPGRRSKQSSERTHSQPPSQRSSPGHPALPSNHRGNKENQIARPSNHHGQSRGKSFPPRVFTESTNMPRTTANSNRNASDSDKTVAIAGYYLDSPAPMPTNSKDMAKNFKSFVNKAEKHRLEVAEVKKEMAKLKETMTQFTESASKEIKNTAVVLKIKALYWIPFHKHKFIQDEAEEAKRAATMYDLYHQEMEEDEMEGKGADYKEIWIKTYSETVSSACNQCRSNIQQMMKKDLCIKFHKTNRFLPSVEQLLNCAKRTIDLTNEDDLKVAELYFMILMRELMTL